MYTGNYCLAETMQYGVTKVNNTFTHWSSRCRINYGKNKNIIICLSHISAP